VDQKGTDVEAIAAKAMEANMSDLVEQEEANAEAFDSIFGL